MAEVRVKRQCLEAAYRTVYPDAHESHVRNFGNGKPALSMDDHKLLDRVVRALAAAEQQGKEAGQAWIPVTKPDGMLAVDEGQIYLFAIEVRTGGEPYHWEYFSDAVVWDSETEADWSSGAHGWGLDDDVWFRACPEPPSKPEGG